MIRVEDALKTYAHRRVLDHISLQIEEGQFVGLFGKNGAGKSTLLKAISQTIRLQSGKILWNEQKLDNIMLGKIGVVSHVSFLYEQLTSLENLRFYGNLYGINHLPKKIDQLLNTVNLQSHSGELVKNLSRGMHQRLALARAMLNDPKVLLLDEPFTGLDIKSIELLESILKNFRDSGKTAIMATHDIRQAARFCTRMIFLQNGKIIIDSSASETIVKQIEEKLKQ